jgi:hypothetical protein
MPIIGCYTLELYCDNQPDRQKPDAIHGYEEFPKQYCNEFGSRCRAMARKDGWKLTKDGGSICPKCAKKVE